MKAYLIDPEARTITEVEYDGKLASIYALTDTEIVECPRFNGSDGVYVDEEGLLKAPTRFFEIAGYPQPLAGKGLVIGTNDAGEDVTPSVDLLWLHENVEFLEHLMAGIFHSLGKAA